MKTRDAFCSYCGTAFVPPLAYPRTCPNPACGTTVWANPIPVAVALVPVQHEGRTGLLVVRRTAPVTLGAAWPTAAAPACAAPGGPCS